MQNYKLRGEAHLWPIAWCSSWGPGQKYLGQTIILTGLKCKQYTPQTFPEEEAHIPLSNIAMMGQNCPQQSPPNDIQA